MLGDRHCRGRIAETGSLIITYLWVGGRIVSEFRALLAVYSGETAGKWERLGAWESLLPFFLFLFFFPPFIWMIGFHFNLTSVEHRLSCNDKEPIL